MVNQKSLNSTEDEQTLKAISTTNGLNTGYKYQSYQIQVMLQMYEVPFHSLLPSSKEMTI